MARLVSKFSRKLTSKEKAGVLAKASIGRKLRVQFEPKAYVTGTIVECDFAGWHRRQTRNHAKFRVVLAAGKEGAHQHVFHVLSLPKGCTQDSWGITQVPALEMRETVVSAGD